MMATVGQVHVLLSVSLESAIFKMDLSALLGLCDNGCN